jgi:hypothetical protein
MPTILMYIVYLKSSILFYMSAGFTECIWHYNKYMCFHRQKKQIFTWKVEYKHTHSPYLHKTMVTFLSISVFLK